MLNRFPIHHICNGVDTHAYQPIDREKCRALLGLTANQKVLMFVAANFGDPRKGGELLTKALRSLPQALKQDICLLTMGDEDESISRVVGMNTLHLGYVGNDRLKSIAYSAADLFVFPTRADNLPVVIQESMACGTPVVSFNVGGVPEMVDPGMTGYLARPGDDQDFSRGILELLEDETLRHRMGQECRRFVLEHYALENQARRYIELYRQVLGKG